MLVPVLVLERRHAIVRPRQVESSGFVFRIRRVALAVVNGVVVVSSAQRDVRTCVVRGSGRHARSHQLAGLWSRAMPLCLL